MIEGVDSQLQVAGKLAVDASNSRTGSTRSLTVVVSSFCTCSSLTTSATA